MKIEILVPETLREITLAQYQAFLASEKTEEALVSIFCGITQEDVKRIKLKSLEQIVQHLNGLFTDDYPFIQRFTLKGVEYGFIPKLDDMTFGEYIDLDEQLTDWKAMHKAMGILYRPITQKLRGKYLIEEYTGQHYQMEAMPLDVALGANVFFWNLSRDLLTAIPNFLEKEIAKMTSQQRATLEENGDGISQYLRSLRETFKGMILSPPSLSTSV